MKRKLCMYGITVILIAFAFIACQKEVSKAGSESKDAVNSTGTLSSSIALQAECGEPVVKDLQDMGGVGDWGDVIISNDNDNITVTVKSDVPGFSITKVTLVYGSQLHVSQFLNAELNWTPCEGPAQYDLQNSYPLGTTTMESIDIPNTNFQEDDCIWIHVSVKLEAEGGALGCAYAYPYDGSVFGSAEWQSGFEYCRQDCPPTEQECDTLRTQTPGGWGAPPSGNNPGAYLHANFAGAFPGGLSVGCFPADYYVSLTTAQAITDLLPTGGKAAALTMNYTDPASIKNVLVGHLVALTLSTGFDAYDPDFGQGGVTLGDMVIGSGTFEGWTVSDFLDEANKVLGGCSNAYTPAQVLETADTINNNYVDGKTDNGFLVCPESDPR